MSLHCPQDRGCGHVVCTSAKIKPNIRVQQFAMSGILLSNVAAVGEEYIGEFGRKVGMCVHAEGGDSGGGCKKTRT